MYLSEFSQILTWYMNNNIVLNCIFKCLSIKLDVRNYLNIQVLYDSFLLGQTGLQSEKTSLFDKKEEKQKKKSKDDRGGGVDSFMLPQVRGAEGIIYLPICTQFVSI